MEPNTTMVGQPNFWKKFTFWSALPLIVLLFMDSHQNLLPEWLLTVYPYLLTINLIATFIGIISIGGGAPKGSNTNNVYKGIILVVFILMTMFILVWIKYYYFWTPRAW